MSEGYKMGSKELKELVNPVDLGTNNGYTYQGTVNGKPLTSTDIAAFDAGSVTGAMGEGKTYSSTSPEKGLFDSFNYGGANGSTGLGGAISAGLGIGQLGLGVMQYLDAEKTSKLNRELLNQQIANNRDTMDTRLARRAQIQKDWGPQANPGLASALQAPKVVYNG